MTIRQDFASYQEAIGSTLRASENRIRNLIGSAHWLTDGEHKESILREAIMQFSPETYRVGTGFVCYPRHRASSGQLDILITKKEYPTLYKRGELHFVTSDAVSGIVEVKTKVARGKALDRIVEKLSSEVKDIRRDNSECWAGLFIYDNGSLTEEVVLDSLRRKTIGGEKGAINCVAIGDDKFVRFWPTSANTYPFSSSQSGWTSYSIEGKSHSYFINNLIAELSPSFRKNDFEAWFSIRGDDGKERFKRYYTFINSDSVMQF